VIGQELAGLRSNEDRTKMLHGERFSAKLDTYTDERNRMYNSLNIPPAKVLQDLGAVNEYDYNLWASDNSVLRLTAYELTYCENGKTVTGTNHEQYVTLEIPLTEENGEVVAYLLDTEDWRDQDWTDFDDWVGRDHLTAGVPPKMITDFLDSLTAYVPDVQHDWRIVPDETKSVMERISKCEACGIEYEVARWR
jgi:hypothetical protein